MAYTVIQAGTSLQFADTDGVLTTLTLPSGVTLRSDVFPRMAVYGDYCFLVNTPSTPLTIDASGTVRVLTPKAPAAAPTLSGVNAGALTGTFTVRYTYIVKDANGNVIAESDFSPTSAAATISAKMLRVTGILVSSDSVSARRLYRTTSNGAVYLPWLDVEGNVLTQIEDDLSDAGLSLIAAPYLGTPPRLTLVKEWRNRLWGVGDTDIDTLVFCEPDAFWSWPDTNSITVPGTGLDRFGIRALIPRRETLGVARRDIFWQVTGQTPDDFRMVKLSENVGIESNETIVVYRDIVLWLWKDGVYQWDGNGINNISDANVGSWFNTSSYFNQAMFASAFAVFDPVRLKYRLFLASAGSTVIDRWVEYDLLAKTWWGPHKTGAFTPSSAFLFTDSDDKVYTATGSSSGYVFLEQDTKTDSSATAIDFDVDTKFWDGDSPDLEKYWGELSVVGKVQSAGTLTVTPKVGYLDQFKGAPISYDMTKGRQRLRRIGNGKLLQFNLRHQTAGENVEVYGLQLPFHILGRR